MSQNPKGTQQLTDQDAKNTNGGSILGGDDSMFKAVSQGYVNQSHTDEDGDTSSNHLDFGSGSLLDRQED